MVPRFAVLLFVLVMFPLLAAAQEAPNAGAPQETPAASPLTVEQALQQAREKKDAGLLQEAADLLQGVLQQNPAHTEALLLTGEILLEAQNFDSARAFFRRVLDVEPNNFRANFGTGTIWLANRVHRQALDALVRAEQVAPAAQRAETKRLLALAYAGIGGRIPTAITKAEEAVRADPSSLDALETLVEIRQAAASRDPRQLQYALAAAEILVQRVKESVDQMPWDRERLLRLSKAYNLNLEVLGTYYRAFNQVVRGRPVDQLRPGTEHQAAAVLNRTVQLLGQRAGLQARLADHERLTLALRAAQLDPTNIKYLEDLGALYQNIMHRQRAVEVYRRILQLDPNHTGAQQYLESVGAAPTTQPGPAEPSPEPGE